MAGTTEKADRKARKLVTDHAIVRYIERVHGIDLSFVAHAILDHGVREAVRMGADSITVDGVEYRIGDGRVVTIIT